MEVRERDMGQGEEEVRGKDTEEEEKVRGSVSKRRMKRRRLEGETLRRTGCVCAKTLAAPCHRQFMATRAPSCV